MYIFLELKIQFLGWRFDGLVSWIIGALKIHI